VIVINISLGSRRVTLLLFVLELLNSLLIIILAQAISVCWHVAEIFWSSCGGPIFVGPLFGRTCWTCVNPPLHSRLATSETGIAAVHRVPGSLVMRQLCVIDTSLNLTRSGTSSQCRSTCISCVRPRSNLLVSLTRRAAAFNRRCNLLVVAFGALASSTYIYRRPKELEAVIRSAIITLKCGYSLQEYIMKVVKRVIDGIWISGEWSEQRMIWRSQ